MDQPELFSEHNQISHIQATWALTNYLHLLNLTADGSDCFLEIGCGPGDVTEQILLPTLPKKFKTFVSSDISEEMIKYAKLKSNDSRIIYKVLDITTDDLKDFGTYNHIFSFQTLHMVRDQRDSLTTFPFYKYPANSEPLADLRFICVPASSTRGLTSADGSLFAGYQRILITCFNFRKAVKNMHTLLVPGGNILITLLTYVPFFEMFDYLFKKGLWVEYMHDYFNPYLRLADLKNEFKTHLEEEGFSINFIEVFDKSYQFPDIDSFRGLMLSVNPFLKRIPESLHENYIADLLSAAKHLGYIGDKINFNFGLLLAVATKQN